jgi:hypothetical protein
MGGPGSSVGGATGYGLDGPGIEFSWLRVVVRCGCVITTSSVLRERFSERRSVFL